MRRSASVSLDRLGADTRQVARDAARRAGVPVEEWLAGVMSEEGAESPVGRRSEAPRRRIAEERPVRATRRRPEPDPVEEARVDVAIDSVNHWIERAERQMAVSTRAVQEQQERAVGAVSEAIALIARRLDDLDRKIDDGREASTAAAHRAVQTLEERLKAVAEQGITGPESRIEDMLRTFEERIAGLGERMAARPLGRRGRAAGEELTDAVAEIRDHQRSLANEAPRGALDALRGDIARIAEQLSTVQSDLGRRGADEAPLNDLQEELGRIRDSVGGLATSGEIGTLERAVRALASDVGRAREPADLAAIAGPVDLLRVQVGRLSDDVAANVHDRLAGEVDRLHDKIDAVASTVSTGREASALETLFGEIADIRGQLAGIAGPDRIQELVRSVRDLDARIAALRAGSAHEHSTFAAMRPLLEDIRASLKAPATGLDAEIGRRFEAFDRKLDAQLEALRERASPAAMGVASGDILTRLEALDAKVERAAKAKDPVVPALREETAGLRAMLADLAKRIDQVEHGGGLDALEKQILALAERLDLKGSDPAIASLESSMADLVAQVATLRDGEGERPPAPHSDVSALKHDLASLRAHHTASNERAQATMEGVHASLEQLVGRLAAVESASRSPEPARPVWASSRAARVEAARAETAGGVARSEAIPTRAETPRVEAPKVEPKAEAPRGEPPETDFDDVLLEPGANRPAPTAHRPEPDSADIKASFIAAARRAAQAAAAEAAASKAPSTPRLDLGARLAGVTGRGTKPAEAQPAAEATSGQSLVARMRGTIERRRRPLLLGLAAVVLALGALQAIGGFVADRTSRPVAAVKAPTVSAPAREAATDPATTQATTPKVAEKAAEKSNPEILAPTRQASIDKAPPLSTERFSAPEPAAPAGPRVTGMAAFAGDLAGLPAGLAALRQAALDGDAAAAYDLAARTVEGRGAPRDPKLAARLFEKLASQGFAPAQYRLGNQYEKAQGLPRDLAAAKDWYRKAAEAGNTRAMHNLAVLLAESGAEPGKPDYAGAAIWFRKAAEHGVRDSQYNLAVLMARGLGAAQDLGQSYLWFSTAAAQGDDDAAKKRDEVGSKMQAKDLEAAKGVVAKWRPKAADPSANEMPAPTAGADAKSNATALMGAPMPILPPAKRAEAGRV